MNTTLIYFILTSSRILDAAKKDITSTHESTLQEIIDVANNHHITVVMKGRFGISASMRSADFEQLFGFLPDPKQSYHHEIHLPLDLHHIADRIEIHGAIENFV